MMVDHTLTRHLSAVIWQPELLTVTSVSPFSANPS